MTTAEAFDNLREAMRDLSLEFAYSLRIDRFCDWLERRLT